MNPRLSFIQAVQYKYTHFASFVFILFYCQNINKQIRRRKKVSLAPFGGDEQTKSEAWQTSSCDPSDENVGESSQLGHKKIYRGKDVRKRGENHS